MDSLEDSNLITLLLMTFYLDNNTRSELNIET